MLPKISQGGGSNPAEPLPTCPICRSHSPPAREFSNGLAARAGPTGGRARPSPRHLRRLIALRNSPKERCKVCTGRGL
jgi:hypothetical protein